MRVTKIVNNNIVISEDKNHKEVVLMGKGLGFQKHKGDEIKLSQIEKTYVMKDHGMTQRFQEMLTDIQIERVKICNKIIQYCLLYTSTSSAQYAEDYLSEDNKITYYKNITKVWNDLEKGTIDATIYDTTGIQNYMQEHADNTNLSVLNEQLNSEESNYGIMFVKGYKYLDQFNVALQVLNNDGTYQKLKEQWIKTKE